MIQTPTAGYAFVEFASAEPDALRRQFAQLGFARAGKHKTKNIELYRQGGIYFLLNLEADSYARKFSDLHGPAAATCGFYVKNATSITTPKFYNQNGSPFAQNVPAVYGIGNSLIYLIDESRRDGFWQEEFDLDAAPVTGAGLTGIDHLSFNVQKGNLEKWAGFYKDVFGFNEIRYFHIKGKKTALRSRALKSGCGTMRVTINESMDDQSQIAEFIDVYKGEGIQHIALNPVDIYESVEAMRKNDLPFVAVPGAYYDMLSERLPNNGEDIERMRKNSILLDGVSENSELLLQIVTPPVVGPLFFEVIQRKGCDGFGEGNFTALFEALERDQIERGVLAA